MRRAGCLAIGSILYFQRASSSMNLINRADTMTLTELTASPSTCRNTPRIVRRSCRSTSSSRLRLIVLSSVHLHVPPSMRDFCRVGYSSCIARVASGFVLFKDGLCVKSPLGPPVQSTRQHPTYGDCLEVKRVYYQNCSVLDCVTHALFTVRSTLI